MKIRLRSQVHENQGVQYRARFFLVLGAGSWWNVGFGVFSYCEAVNDLKGWWAEIRLGWWRLIISAPRYE